METIEKVLKKSKITSLNYLFCLNSFLLLNQQSFKTKLSWVFDEDIESLLISSGINQVSY